MATAFSRSGLVGVVVLAVATVGLAPGVSDGGENRLGGFAHKNKPENLAKLWKTIVMSVKSGNYDKALALAKPLLLDDAAFKLALRDGVDPAIVKDVAKRQKRMADSKPEDMARGFKPKRTEIKVHAATPKQIIAQKTAASREFSGGAVRAAKTVLRSGVTFYEVELLEPGHERGTKMHLMFWDGAQWRMLGPVWRSMPRAATP